MTVLDPQPMEARLAPNPAICSQTARPLERCPRSVEAWTGYHAGPFDFSALNNLGPRTAGNPYVRALDLGSRDARIRPGPFRKMGGFDDAFRLNFNDTDSCLRVRSADFRVMDDAGDPFYSPHRTRDREELSLRVRP
jgi:hypothetical protein